MGKEVNYLFFKGQIFFLFPQTSENNSINISVCLHLIFCFVIERLNDKGFQRFTKITAQEYTEELSHSGTKGFCSRSETHETPTAVFLETEKVSSS